MTKEIAILAFNGGKEKDKIYYVIMLTRKDVILSVAMFVGKVKSSTPESQTLDTNFLFLFYNWLSVNNYRDSPTP